MTTIATVSKDVDNFCSMRPLETARTTDVSRNILSNVREEVENAKESKLLCIDQNNHTNGMISVIRNPLEQLNKWTSERNRMQSRVRQAIDDGRLTAKETEHQALINNKESAIAKANDEFNREHDYLDAKRELEATEDRYNKMNMAAGGKPPVKANYFLYVLAILCVGGVELFLNYSTLVAKYAAPGIALGGTLLIGLCFAVAAHFHGGYLKQRLDLVGPDVEPRRRYHIYRVQTVATVLLIVGMAAVSIIRYQVLLDEMMGGYSLPGTEQQQSAFEVLVPFILMNLLVWIIGAFISYSIHDDKPSYQEAQRDCKKARSRFNKLDKGLQEHLSQVEAKYAKELEELKNSHDAERDNLDKLNKLLVDIDVHSRAILREIANVLNRDLQNYHSNLVMRLRASNMADIQFGADLISLDMYQKTNVNIDNQSLVTMVG